VALGFESGVSVMARGPRFFMGTFTGLIVLARRGGPWFPGCRIRCWSAVTLLNGLLCRFELSPCCDGNDREIMGVHVNGRLYNLVAWRSTFLVSLLSLALLVQTRARWSGWGRAERRKKKKKNPALFQEGAKECAGRYVSGRRYVLSGFRRSRSSSGRARGLGGS